MSAASPSPAATEPPFAGPVAILGLGLIGGSLARDLSALGITVWGFDRDAEAIADARRAGVIVREIDAQFRALSDAETIVLAVPVDAALTLLDRVQPHCAAATLITDVGSTKRSIVQQATAVGLDRCFVGSHPLAGDHRAGWQASRRGLFAGARVDLCRTPRSTDDAVARASALWSLVGAQTAERDATMHDSEMAFVSHFPQLLALALAGTMSSHGIARNRLGSGGRDMTRMAASSSEMWEAIFEDNAVPVMDALDTCLAQLGALRGAIARGDRRAVGEAFRAGRKWVGED